MTGREEKNIKTYAKIEKIINLNKDKKYLKGFSFYISNMSPNSIESYIKYIINFMNYVKKDPSDLTVDDYTEYMFFIKNKTSSYKIAVYSALKKFSTYLKSNGTNERNPMDFIKRPKAIETQETKNKREKGYLTNEEIKVYLKNIESVIKSENKKGNISSLWATRDYLMVLLFLNTGMRCSALCQINIEDIDFENKTIVVYEKEDKIITYYLNDKIIKFINQWLEYRQNLNLNNTKALFLSNRHRRMSEANIYRTINKYGFNIEGKKLSPHKLRATYGTQLYDATKDIVFVQKAMNHNSSHTTELYIRGKEDVAKKQASDIMTKLTFE